MKLAADGPGTMFCTIIVNGQHCPVTNLFDDEGNELGPDDTLEMVGRVVAQLPDGRWLATEADYSDLRPLN